MLSSPRAPLLNGYCNYRSDDDRHDDLRGVKEYKSHFQLKSNGVMIYQKKTKSFESEEGLSELRKRLEDSLPDNLSITDSSKEVNEKNILNNIPRPPALPMGPLVDPQGLILPRKPFNPCLDSKDRQDLHRELLFNQRIGKNVLNQKSELQKALEKHRDLQTKKELENEKNQNKSLLERVIEERARRIESLEKKEETTTRLPEFMQVHARLKSCSNRDNK